MNCWLVNCGHFKWTINNCTFNKKQKSKFHPIDSADLLSNYNFLPEMQLCLQWVCDSKSNYGTTPLPDRK